MKIRYYLIVIILLITVLPISFLTIWFLKKIAYEYMQRANLQLEQINLFINSALESKIKKLSEIMSSLDKYIAGSDADLLADLQLSNCSPQVIHLASDLKNASGLDYLEIIDQDGKILSSGHWIANFGQYHRNKILWKDDSPVFHKEQIVDRYYLSIQIKHPIELMDKMIYLIGGYRLDENSLLPNYLPSEVLINFSLNPKQRINIYPKFTKEFKNERGKSLAILEAYVSMGSMNKIIKDTYKTFIVVSILLICFSILLGIFLSHHITKPLEILASAASEIGKGNLQKNINYTAKGEFSSLISAFNYMIVSLKEAQNKLLEAERINAWREAARRMAHEIKNPISPIQVCIKTLLKVKKDKPEIFDNLFEQSSITILEEVDKLHALANSFSLFAQMPTPSKTLIDINNLIERVIQLYRSSGENYQINLNLNEDIPLVMGDQNLISSALNNIIKNALEALPKENPELIISTNKIDDGREWIRIVISDNGEGIDLEDLPNIFKPYFTKKAKGTGLGLTIAKEIIDQHEGRIFVESIKGKGTTFFIDLPLI